MMRYLRLLLLAVLFSACSVQTFLPPGADALTPTPSEAELRASAELTVKTFLAIALGITTEEVRVVSVEQLEWSSACLGLTRPGLACSPDVTPGYRFILEAQGQRFEYHTNVDGSTYVPIDPVYIPDIAVDIARRTLAAQTNIPQAEINTVRVSMVAWPDTCLAIVQINDVCVQQTTYGYDIVLEARAKTYEFHVTDNGETIRQK